VPGKRVVHAGDRANRTVGIAAERGRALQRKLTSIVVRVLDHRATLRLQSVMSPVFRFVFWFWTTTAAHLFCARGNLVMDSLEAKQPKAPL